VLAITIGNFDGVHRGHAELVARARSRAGSAGTVVAVTFEPHPVARLRPHSVPPRLTTARERRQQLLEAGASDVLELDPTPELLALMPLEFVRALRARLPFDVIVEGHDFRFGHGRSGSIETLRTFGRGFEAGEFAVEVVDLLDVALDDGTVVQASSSLVRWLLAQGRVRHATSVLGRPYAVVAATAPGDRRGRTIGYPTLNLGNVETMMPADGVYGGSATLEDGRRFIAAISVGTKPTFARTLAGGIPQRTCEAHLLDASLPLDWYGHVVRIEFETWIREQVTFESLESLVARIAADVREIRDRSQSRMSPRVRGVAFVEPVR